MALPAARPLSAAAVLSWRRAERARLLEIGAALPLDERRRRAKAAREHAAAAIPHLLGQTVALYWPAAHEVSVLGLARSILAAGGVAALPVDAPDGRPFHFRAWTPGDPLAAGPSAPFPRDGPMVQPQVVFVALAGFDGENYRLCEEPALSGRLLAAAPEAYAVGVGLELMRLETVAPLAGERPLDLVVTEAGAFRPQ